MNDVERRTKKNILKMECDKKKTHKYNHKHGQCKKLKEKNKRKKKLVETKAGKKHRREQTGNFAFCWFAIGSP